jgi:DNA-directed RNA polymerase specialized sigma24 family protein
VDAATFQALLLALDPNHDKAAQDYRRLHERLVRFFSLHPVADPYALADEALDRLARRVAADPNEVITPSAFLVGIARHLLQEEERRRIRESKAAQEWAPVVADSSSEDEDLHRRLERCLNTMRKEQRELLIEYYRSTGRQKIEHHRELAAKLGITLNALRNRLMRARKELDDCVRRSRRDVSSTESTRR